MVFNKLNAIFCNCIIGRGAEFGPGFVLIHSTGVVINGQVRGGSNVHIEHQVTIGAERGQSPHLGDDLFVGAGAKVIGPVQVGDGARIGANAVVVHDIPPHSTVVGNPARVVRRRERPGRALAMVAPTHSEGLPEPAAERGTEEMISLPVGAN
jgi:serine O-acetyltransferase